MDKKKTGNMIKEARVKKGYTQQELGDIVGVTNKAISRWETGEAFPDVALLDTIANALELGIDEIVLGDKKEEKNDLIASELVNIAKIERGRRNRKLLSRCICIASIVALFVFGISVMLNGLSSWPIGIIYYCCFLSVFTLGIFVIKNKQHLLGKKKREIKIASVISVALTVYSLILVFGTLSIYCQGKTLFGMENSSVGPFIVWQLFIVFCFELLAVLFFFWENVCRGNDFGIDIYIPILGIFLSLSYSALLHDITSLEGIRVTFLIATIVIVTIILCGVLLTVLVSKIKSDKIKIITALVLLVFITSLTLFIIPPRDSKTTYYALEGIQSGEELDKRYAIYIENTIMENMSRQYSLDDIWVGIVPVSEGEFRGAMVINSAEYENDDSFAEVCKAVMEGVLSQYSVVLNGRVILENVQ